MAALCEVYQLRVESRDQDSPETKGGDSEMMTAPDLVLIAKAHNAVCTETSQIAWIDHLQEWHELKHHRPSVLDAAVLDHAFKVGPSYFEAVKAATGWSRETIVAFQTIMLLGEPVESGNMDRNNMRYWKGIIMGLFVYEKIKVRYT
jgi:hypothetical protein